MDVYDVIFVIGAGFLGYGLWLIWSPLTFVFIGFILLSYALGGAHRKARRPEE